MFFLQYRAGPMANHPEVSDTYGGAYVNCWMDRPTAVEAEIAAKKLIESNGWQIFETLEVYEANESDYGMGDKAQQYFEQALTDSEVLVFYIHPPGEMADEEEEP